MPKDAERNQPGRATILKPYLLPRWSLSLLSTITMSTVLSNKSLEEAEAAIKSSQSYRASKGEQTLNVIGTFPPSYM
jgi:hypothetical protein